MGGHWSYAGVIQVSRRYAGRLARQVREPGIYHWYALVCSRAYGRAGRPDGPCLPLTSDSRKEFIIK